MTGTRGRLRRHVTKEPRGATQEVTPSLPLIKAALRRCSESNPGPFSPIVSSTSCLITVSGSFLASQEDARRKGDWSSSGRVTHSSTGHPAELIPHRGRSESSSMLFGGGGQRITWGDAGTESMSLGSLRPPTSVSSSPTVTKPHSRQRHPRTIYSWTLVHASLPARL